MTLILLSREQLQVINKRTLKYNLAEAEKDYFLTVVSKVINESELAKKIVFKGGTAIHHCYLPQSRFSEDLDFTALDATINLEEVKKVLEAQDFLSVKKEFVSKATIKLERVRYEGVLDQPNSLKVEIDFIQNVVLPPKTMPYKNVWGVDVQVNVMDIREISAEKIRAMNDRIRYRDFFDFYLIMKEIKPNLTEILELVRQKEVRKVISKENILEHWKLAKADKQKELDIVRYSATVFDDDELITHALKELDFEPIPINSVFQKKDE
ncbi:MAG TPA: nucleotidyl transferase AbiEii/AbiGii toxin family protein [Candidatus Dormibacteraeota bacterium]|nr:nucleotidyl transferase AbiEii/AbiGii toxin family protein [Candidatus Dormibacteraeota bacterium]